MKRIYFVVLMLLVCAGGFSQKVKIKKNIISLDGVEVGITERYENKKTKEEGYTYSDLKGENKFTMVRYFFGQDSLYFVVRPNFAKDTAEIKMEYLYFTLNQQNALTDLLVKKYHFFDKNGMNINAINEYLSAGYEQQIPKIQRQKQEQKQAAEKQKQIVGNMNIRVINGTIEMDRVGSAGSFVEAPDPNKAISQNNPVLIKDELGNIIAKVTTGGDAINDFNTTIVTYDNNIFEFRFGKSYDSKNPNPYYQTIAEFLAQKEYLKGQRNSFLPVRRSVLKMNDLRSA